MQDLTPDIAQELQLPAGTRGVVVDVGRSIERGSRSRAAIAET